ncbi:MAG: type II secretion system protein J [Candidatus Methylacidiphilales bacterium]|nr:prepilin-type N-terminal cleavage/methylation domain-containing protein [Candidatus Methylacidiphilales bacterium]
MHTVPTTLSVRHLRRKHSARALRGTRAFTLIELMVAGALLMVLLGILFSVINNTTSVISRATEQIDVTRVARESLDLIGRDISKAALPWNRTSTNSLQFLLNPSGAPASMSNPDSLFWQAPVARNDGRGNMAIIGYFVLRDLQTATPTKTRLQLRRAFIEAQSSSGAANSEYIIYSNPTAWASSTVFGNFAPATTDADNLAAQKGWVADGVLGMWVRLLDRTGTPLTASTFDSRQAASTFLDSKNTTNKVTYPTNYSVLPSFVEVSLVCVAPRQVVRIKSLPAAPTTSATNFEAPIATYMQQIKAANPGIDSINTFSRKFRILRSE